jgi:hypothetical protein
MAVESWGIVETLKHVSDVQQLHPLLRPPQKDEDIDMEDMPEQIKMVVKGPTMGSTFDVCIVPLEDLWFESNAHPVQNGPATPSRMFKPLTQHLARIRFSSRCSIERAQTTSHNDANKQISAGRDRRMDKAGSDGSGGGFAESREADTRRSRSVIGRLCYGGLRFALLLHQGYGLALWSTWISHLD